MSSVVNHVRKHDCREYIFLLHVSIVTNQTGCLNSPLTQLLQPVYVTFTIPVRYYGIVIFLSLLYARVAQRVEWLGHDFTIEGAGFDLRQQLRDFFFRKHLYGAGAHQPDCHMGTGVSFLHCKAPGLVAGDSPPFDSEVRSTWSCTFTPTPHVCL
jgi:hypothetical protein